MAARKITRSFVIFVLIMLGAVFGLKRYPPLGQDMWRIAAFTAAGAALLAVAVLKPAGIGALFAPEFQRLKNRNVRIFLGVILLVGWPLIFFAASAGWLSTVNGFFDTGAVTCHDVNVTAQHAGGKSGPNVSVTSWRPDAATLGVGVTTDAYHRISIGTPMRVCSKPGRLGVEWLWSWMILTRQ